MENGDPYGEGVGLTKEWQKTVVFCCAIQPWITSGTADADSDGYTDLEEFLTERAGDQDASGQLLMRVGTGQGGVPAVN